MNNILEVKNLSFYYDEYDSRTGLSSKGKSGINNISFSIPEGSFVTLCGSTGSGKSTLLKLIKGDIITSGTLTGQIVFDGTDINEIDSAVRASSIGLLFQNPEDQIVTDKVWHEIAFGLENLGMAQSEMETRLAEALAFFRLENISRHDTATLSGGQKQLVSLAGVLAMYPRLLLLDEPTSQLDPESAEHYISTIKKLQTALGLTVIIAEHNLDGILPVSDMLMVMDNGALVCCDTVENALNIIASNKISDGISNKQSDSLTDASSCSSSKICADLPLATRYGISIGAKNLPLDINSGRRLIKDNIISAYDTASKPAPGNEPLVKLKNISFRYTSSGSDILSDLSATFDKGCSYAILGCNASGKSTLLKLLTGNIKAQLGQINPRLSHIKTAYMPQDTDNMFIADTVEKELLLVGLRPENYPEYIKHIDYAKSPFDLSGGEKQLVGLAKVTALSPQLLLLDEPTKGTDNISRRKMTVAINALKESGTTIIMACHDMDFAAECADKCAILSMGRLTGFKSCEEFFTDNKLYTTSARAMTVGITEGIYLESQLLK